MMWFGSSAVVALCSVYPQGRSAGLWLRHGWPVIVAYVAGFFVLLAVLGWHLNPQHKAKPAQNAAAQSAAPAPGAGAPASAPAGVR